MLHCHQTQSAVVLRFVEQQGFLGAALALVIGASLACTSTSSVMSTPSPTTWTLVWSDEFDGVAGARIDSTKWGYD